MRATHYLDWRANQQLPVVDFSKELEFDPERQTEVVLQYTTEQHPDKPELRYTETNSCVVNLDILRTLRSYAGRIWALKYVRACTVSEDAPYGCSLLVAKNFVDAFCPAEKYAEADERREQERRLPAILEENKELREMHYTAQQVRWELMDELHKYRDRFGSWKDIESRDPDPRD